jgi:hypothetical protein
MMTNCGRYYLGICRSYRVWLIDRLRIVQRKILEAPRDHATYLDKLMIKHCGISENIAQSYLFWLL